MSIIKDKLKEGEIIPLTFDPMFTEVFNNEENISILEEFISSYLDIPLEKVKGNLVLLSRNLKRKNLIDSKKEVDLLLDLEGEKYNIELSNKAVKGVIDRNIVYLCNIHGSQLKSGVKSYTTIKKSLQINLNTYDSEDKLKTKYYLKNEEGKILSKKLEIDVINVAKGRRLCYTGNEEEDILIGWSKVLTSKTKEEIEENLKKVLSVKPRNLLVENIDRLSGDDEMVRIYTKLSRREIEENTYREEIKEEALKEGHEEGFKSGLKQGLEQGIEQGIEQGLEQGLEEGLQKGMKEKSIEIAKNLLNSSLTLEEIVSHTGIDIKDLKKLKKESN